MQTETANRGMDDLIDAAQSEPVTLLQGGLPAAVIVSLKDFRRFEEQERLRREAGKRLMETITKIHNQPANQALTNEEMDRLLADES